MIELPLTPEQVAIYRASAIRRRERDRAAEQERRALAWLAAREAAELLRTRYHVSRVVVFGSLVQNGRFTRWSDVDIAAWGLNDSNWLHAIGAVMDMKTGFEMNLVDVTVCKPAILESIEREGIDI